MKGHFANERRDKLILGAMIGVTEFFKPRYWIGMVFAFLTYYFFVDTIGPGSARYLNLPELSRVGYANLRRQLRDETSELSKLVRLGSSSGSFHQWMEILSKGFQTEAQVPRLSNFYGQEVKFISTDLQSDYSYFSVLLAAISGFRNRDTRVCLDRYLIQPLSLTVLSYLNDSIKVSAV